MYYDILNSHHIVALDIDETLISGPRSIELQDWVSRNHEKKEIHLVTFRTGYTFDLISDTLRWNKVPKEWFRGIHGIPQDVIDAFNIAQDIKKLFNSQPKKAARSLKYHKISEQQIDNFIRAAKCWKGKKCNEIGATVMVDDLEDMVLPGCKRYGIQFVNSL